MNDEARNERDTPSGTLYKPKTLGVQILFLFAAFAGGPFAGWLMAESLGDLSHNAQGLLYGTPMAIFILGYALWSARLTVIALDVLGRGILRAFFELLVRRKRPKRLEEVLPTMEKLEEMAVRAQKAASSFLIVAIPVAAVSGFAITWVDSDRSALTRVAVVAAGCLVWGQVLSWLARRGYLPVLSGGD